MSAAVWVLLSLPVLTAGYAYVGYPVLLALLARRRRTRAAHARPDEWPEITVTIAAYNEEASIARTLENLLTADYPSHRRHVVVISDASTDRTDEIVQEFADRGVKLVRLPRRSGKTAAENASREHIRGSIVVNTDASVLVDRAALKPLVAAFADPGVGVASGRDVSVAPGDVNPGEGGYVSYEMAVRRLETAVDGIVGASGCFFGSRAELHHQIVPEALSRDFAAPLIAREHGFRSVSIDAAVCYVPRASSVRTEYRRKVRTMARGLETLFYKRHLLNPIRFGTFAWMLWSHKVVRWMTPWTFALGIVGLALAAPSSLWARVALGACAGLGLLAAINWSRRTGELPWFLAAPSYVALGLVAGIHAWCKALRGEMNPIWEPTRRDALRAP